MVVPATTETQRRSDEPGGRRRQDERRDGRRGIEFIATRPHTRWCYLSTRSRSDATPTAWPTVQGADTGICFDGPRSNEQGREDHRMHARVAASKRSQRCSAACARRCSTPVCADANTCLVLAVVRAATSPRRNWWRQTSLSTNPCRHVPHEAAFADFETSHFLKISVYDTLPTTVQHKKLKYELQLGVVSGEFWGRTSNRVWSDHNTPPLFCTPPKCFSF